MNHDIDRTQIGLGPRGGYNPPSSTGPVVNQMNHSQLVADLMDVNSEQELEYFLGDVISGTANSLGKFISSPTGQALGSGLKVVAKQLLPVAGQALGGYVAGPTGAQIGGALGNAAAGLLDSEMEERDWQAANTFVKVASEAVKNAAEAPAAADPRAVAEKAIVDAAQKHAPHIVPTLTGEARSNGGQPECGCRNRREASTQHGRWYRHGDRIVVVGV